MYASATTTCTRPTSGGWPKAGVRHEASWTSPASPSWWSRSGPLDLAVRRGFQEDRYEAAAVAELWLVDTAADSVLVYRRSAAEAPGFDVALELARDDRLTSPLLPGFAMAVRDVFAP